MRYLFMNNFRGFANTLVPLRQTNFLVGENSTGKSSLLKLFSIMSSTQFAFAPDFHLQTGTDLGGYDDIVSANSSDRSVFSVGVAVSAEATQNNPATRDRFWVYTFENNEGAARLVRYIHHEAGRTVTFILARDSAYFSEQTAPAPLTEAAMLSLLQQLERAPPTEQNATRIDRTGPNTQLVFAIQAAQMSEEREAAKRGGPPPRIDPWNNRLPYNVTEIAPIRSKPERYYDSMKLSFSPEGNHVPLMLRRALESGEKSAKFAASFKAFGKASGLFDAIVAHPFGKKSPQSPFELRVKFSGVNLNINNVGYGVSQVFPLVVQFLLAPAQTSFAVQQPEVHLHPRAQSALGDLVYRLAKSSKHSFLLETHSDYLIDRYRLAMSEDSSPPDSQTLFFERTNRGNVITALPISSQGKYQADQPKSFREFFIKEEMKLLDI